MHTCVYIYRRVCGCMEGIFKKRAMEGERIHLQSSLRCFLYLYISLSVTRPSTMI